MEVVRQTAIVPTPGTLFQTELEFKLDQEEQESDPKPPLPPPNLINPIFGYCQDKNCSLCPTKSTVKFGEFFTCFPQKITRELVVNLFIGILKITNVYKLRQTTLSEINSKKS